ncbi:glycosyltransferase family 2 protein [Herbaspirillum rubrisubalbicans Os34]|uniref:Glycosyltransferase family 2 protein n=2 Tax=Oxalobacteraceae TaxID=75682 RepID=A0A6M3ZQS6_9BURK|nr:glycosyltransferase family 2 protein [Herbaspirillum rubrisubalbicans Os34]
MTMTIAPLFSIIVTTHRRPAILERALRSLLAQSFVDYEIVLVADEGSIPTKEVASRLLREKDVFLCLPGAKGPAESRNAGVQLARGRFILFLDDDDSYRPDFLQAIVQCNRFLSDAVNYVSYTQLKEVRTPEGTHVLSSTEVDTGATDIRTLLVSNFIPNNAIVLSSSIAKRHLVDATLQSHEDWDYLISLVLKYEFNFLGISGPVVHINEGQSRNNDAKSNGSIALDFLSIYRKWPAADDELRLRRKEMLRTLGLDLPPAML